ncbi:uncharacterized protein LOC107175622 [Citrus sinensis]|uniref:uncharacterized protein LOC112100890 n=1 Tax=Citrus clementina TaxID=85681 RepID=UPI00076394B5|nr:uncharacterized protein LOC112100890 [Citrus x clementina]XP_052290842.1 uncharacterized protein LOC107175622 [Citrus sinensis]
MSNQKRKLIADESDEETRDSDLNLSIPTDFLRPSSSVGPSYGRATLEYPRSLAVSPTPELELVGNRGGPASGSGENHSFGGVGDPEGVGDGEGSSSEPSGPAKKRNLGHRVEADSYPIDFITCATTHTDLFKLRNLYNIPNEVLLVAPGKGDVLSRPPKGSATPKRVEGSLGDVCIVGEMRSWGLIEGLEDRPLLQVETALVNATTCQDLMSPTNLVGSGLVDIAPGMDNKILSAMSRKRGRASSSSSNPPPPPKKTNVGPSKAHVPALPPPPPRRSGGEKASDKSPEVSIQSGDRSSPLPSQDQGDHLSPYQKDYRKSVGPKMVKDIESMDLSELAGSVQKVSFRLATLVSCYKNGSTRLERRLQADNQELKKKAESADRSKEKLAELNKQITDLEEKATQSERDTLRTAIEGEIKSLSEQLAEEKGKSADVDDRLDAEYDSGVAFSYKCFMSVLKEEYPELDMSKLEAGVERYMAEAGQGDKGQGEQDQVEAPLDRVQEGEAGGRTFEVGQGSVPPPPGIPDLPPPQIADPLPSETVDPSAAGTADSPNL